ncbi:hypothetical protein BB560_005231, partial [Smittium megazygosporum]
MKPLFLDFDKFIQENEHLLVPPVNNKTIFRTNDYIVMVVGGPNARTDFHINTTDEWFYQIKGRAEVNVYDEDSKSIKNIVLDKGKMAVVPGNVPHNPVRHPDSLGLVVERVRPQGTFDKMRWYCSKCSSPVHEVEFQLETIDHDIAFNIQKIKDNDLKDLVCKHC